MAARKHRGRGPSPLLLTPDYAGNVVGIDRHTRTLTAVVVDARGAILAGERFRVSGEGHRALLAWARSFGAIARWGVETASGWGRHTAIFLAGREQDVRDVCPNRTARAERARSRGTSDTLDADRVARELLAHSMLPKGVQTRRRPTGRSPTPRTSSCCSASVSDARSGPPANLCSNAAEMLLSELPLKLREQRPDSSAVRPRLAALAGRRVRPSELTVALRLRLLREQQRQITHLDREQRAVCRELAGLLNATGSPLDELCGLATRSVAERLVEVGDIRRFTEAGFARFDGSAPIPARTGEGPGEPVRHRLNPGGNRRLNAILPHMAVTQLRSDPRAQTLYANARAPGKTKKEARRILKRHLSNVIYRHMTRDLAAPPPTTPLT